jgi:sortase A
VRNIGLIVLLFAGWQLWGTSIEQHQAQNSLRAAFQSRVHHPSSSAPGPRLLGPDVRLPQPPEGSVVAHLQIPSLGVDQYVVEGTAEGDLAKGPGHYTGTAVPGQAGNVAIAGHRTTYGAPFSNLEQLKPGSSIVLTADTGLTLHYVVTQPPTPVPPSDVSVLNYFGDDRLTLTTCNPRFSASQRLIVVAQLRESTGARPEPATRSAISAHRGARRIVSESVGWRLVYLPIVVVLLALMACLGLANKRAARYFGHRGRWLILAPIWIATIYIFFGVLTSFLPATL